MNRCMVMACTLLTLCALRFAACAAAAEGAAPRRLPLPAFAPELPEPLRPLASRYLSERQAAADALVALPLNERQAYLPALIELARGPDWMACEAAVRVLAASAPMLSESLPVLQGLAIQAVKANDGERVGLFVPICVAVNASASVAALAPVLKPLVEDSDGWRVALRATQLTGASGAPMVESVLPLLAHDDETIAYEASQTLGAIGAGSARVVTSLLQMLGPFEPEYQQAVPLRAYGAAAALDRLAAEGGIPTAPEKLLPLSCRKVRPWVMGRFGTCGIPLAAAIRVRAQVAVRQGERGVDALVLELDAILGDALQDTLIAGASAKPAAGAGPSLDGSLDSALDGELGAAPGAKTEAIGPPPPSVAGAQSLLRQILPACAAALGDPRVKSRLARVAADARWEVATEAARMLNEEGG